MSTLLIFLTFLCFVVSTYRYGLVPFPTGLIGLYVFCQAYILLFNMNVTTFSMLETFNFGGVSANEIKVISILLFISIYVVVVFSGYKRQSDRSASNVIIRMRNNPTVRSIMSISSFFLIIYFVIFSLFADWSAVWSNSVYLSSFYNVEMSKYDLFGIGVMSFKIIPLILILTATGLSFALWLRLPFASIVFVALGFFFYFLMLGMHSRSAMFSPAIIAAIAYILRPKHFRKTVIVCVLIAAASLQIAFTGRSTSQQGLSAIPGDIADLFDFRDNQVDTLSGQIAQGAFVLAETLQLDPEFSTRYKILSFSPLPSFIDGFDSILGTDQIRLHTFVPMGGVGEIIQFGPAYVCLAAFVLLFAARLNIMVATRSKLVFILVNFLLMCGVYACLAYPLRTGLRFVWLSVALSTATLLFSSKPSPMTPPELDGERRKWTDRGSI